MGTKPRLSPAPTYRPLETYWDNDEDAPGPRCSHTLTAVAATKNHGPRLILFGGAPAIEGGASSSAPGISTFSLPLSCSVFRVCLILSFSLNSILQFVLNPTCMKGWRVWPILFIPMMFLPGSGPGIYQISHYVFFLIYNLSFWFQLWCWDRAESDQLVIHLHRGRHMLPQQWELWSPFRYFKEYHSFLGI